MTSMTQCRVAPSLGALEGDPHEVWGTVPYKKREGSCVFFGLYDLRDYWALWRHKGHAWVLWAGSDLRNLEAGFVFNDGKLRMLSKILRGNWWVIPILRKAEHWVENDWERAVLEKYSIQATVRPSFMGNVGEYEMSFTPGNRVYLSSGAGRQYEYGFGIVERIAPQVPEVEFHLYGAPWDTKQPNIIVHGRVPKEQMNEEIRRMQCGLRLNETDGFSEVTAKSVLWGQWPISRLHNPYVTHAPNTAALIEALRAIPTKEYTNAEAHAYYRKMLNRYPWNRHVQD